MRRQDILELGFNLIKRYEHDNFTSFRYGKGLVEIEFTFDEDLKQVSCDTIIKESDHVKLSLHDIKSILPVMDKMVSE